MGSSSSGCRAAATRMPEACAAAVGLKRVCCCCWVRQGLEHGDPAATARRRMPVGRRYPGPGCGARVHGQHQEQQHWRPPPMDRWRRPRRRLGPDGNRTPVHVDEARPRPVGRARCWIVPDVLVTRGSPMCTIVATTHIPSQPPPLRRPGTAPGRAEPQRQKTMPAGAEGGGPGPGPGPGGRDPAWLTLSQSENP